MKAEMDRNKANQVTGSNLYVSPTRMIDLFVDPEFDYYQVFDNLNEGVVIFDQEFRLIYGNSTAKKHYPFIKPQHYGKSIIINHSDIISSVLFQAVLNCLETHHSTTFEGNYSNPEGNTGWLEYGLKPIPNGVLVLTSDISEKKRIEQVLRENEDFYHSFFDNLLNGFAYCGLLFKNEEVVDFSFLAINKAFETLTGLHDVTNKPVSIVIPGFSQNDKELFELFTRVAKTGQSVLVEKYSTSLQNWLNLSVYSPVKDHFVAIFDVITSRKEAEAKLVDQINELQRWYSATIDREARNIELKREVNELLMESGKPPRYADIGNIG